MWMSLWTRLKFSYWNGKRDFHIDGFVFIDCKEIIRFCIDLFDTLLLSLGLGSYSYNWEGGFRLLEEYSASCNFLGFLALFFPLFQVQGSGVDHNVAIFCRKVT